MRLFNSDNEAEDFSDFNEQEKDEDNSMTFPGRLLYFFFNAAAYRVAVLKQQTLFRKSIYLRKYLCIRVNTFIKTKIKLWTPAVQGIGQVRPINGHLLFFSKLVYDMYIFQEAGGSLSKTFHTSHTV